MNANELLRDHGTVIETALRLRIDEMLKLHNECDAAAAQYEALDAAGKAEYDTAYGERTGKQTPLEGGGFTINCEPHPRGYRQMATLFDQQANQAQAALVAYQETEEEDQDA